MIGCLRFARNLEFARLSNLFRNVPFLTSLEMSLFLLICLVSLGCPPERSPAPRVVRRDSGGAEADIPTTAASCDRFNRCNFILCSYPFRQGCSCADLLFACLAVSRGSTCSSRGRTTRSSYSIRSPR